MLFLFDVPLGGNISIPGVDHVAAQRAAPQRPGVHRGRGVAPTGVCSGGRFDTAAKTTTQPMIPRANTAASHRRAVKDVGSFAFALFTKLNRIV